MKTIYLSLLLLFFSVVTQAQKITLFDSSNSILPKHHGNMVVDRQGNVWIFIPRYGTYKYDGHEFIHIDTLNNRTEALFTDKKGNVWFSENSTITMFDGKNWVKYTKEQTGIQQMVYTIAEAPSGKLYIGTSDGLFTFDGSHWEQVNLPQPDIYIYAIRSIDFGPENNIAISCNQGLLLSDADGKWKKFNEYNSKLALGSMPAVKYSPTGELYIGYGGGLGAGGFSILKNNEWKSDDKYNSKLQDQIVRSIVFTPNNIIWLVTNNGLLKIKGDELTPIKFIISNNESISNIASYNNILWINSTDTLIKYEE